MADQQQTSSDFEKIEHAADIVTAYVSNNKVAPDELPALLRSVHGAISALGQPTPAPTPVPPVNPKKTVFEDRIISLEDGKSYKSLKRHLSTRGLTPDGYRAKWGLPADYPMVASSYSARRSELAKKLGLGRRPAAKATRAKGTAKR